MLDKEFKDFPSEKSVSIDNNIWDLVIRINVEPYKLAYSKKSKDEGEQAKIEEAKKKLEDFAKKTAEKFGKFRSMFYSSPMEKMLKELNDKKSPEKMTINLNEETKMHLLPMKDRIFLIYGLNFKQYTDVSLVKVLIQEIEESKRHVNGCVGVSHYDETKEIPDYIVNVDKAKNYSNGLLVFMLMANKLDKLRPKFHKFVFLKDYIQFHVHSIKTFLHIRMTKKAKYLGDKLNACKIIPEDYFKKMRDINFFLKQEKNEKKKEIFNQETKKINV